MMYSSSGTTSVSAGDRPTMSKQQPEPEQPDPRQREASLAAYLGIYLREVEGFTELEAARRVVELYPSVESTLRPVIFDLEHGLEPRRLSRV